MPQSWSLKALYPSFDSELFQKDMTLLESRISALNSQSNTLETLLDLEKYIFLNTEIRALISKLMGFSRLRFSTNTKDEKALIALNRIQTGISQLTPAHTKLIKFLSQVKDLETFIAPSEALSQLIFVLKTLKESGHYMLSEAEEILISKLTLTGSSAFSTLQSKLTSSLTVDFEYEGTLKSFPIASLRNFASHKDAAVRKSAYETELKAYKQIDEAVAMALNSIKGEVITLSELRGYASPLEMTLKKSKMSQKTLDAMMGAIESELPKFHRYLKVKARFLGHNGSLPFYDLMAPIGEASKHYTYEEGCQLVLDNFKTFSEALYQMAKKTIENDWIDVSPKPGKVSGAFCSSLHPIGEFRILLNYTGTLGDVTTLAHELGHGYHAICTNDEHILNTDYPMPLAETASTFCETIVNNAAIKESSPSEQVTILENMLQDATQVICDIYSRYLFETELFKVRKDHPLSVDEINTLMTNAQKSAYGDGLDENILHPYMWLIKPHYYSAGLNFYNFPYAFGLLFAKGLYAKYLENPEFFKSKYDLLLAASGKMPIVDVCKILDIDVESQAFWKASLDILTKDIEHFEALVKEAL